MDEDDAYGSPVAWDERDVIGVDRRFARWLRDEYQSERLLPGLTPGVLMGITGAIIALSMGSLIFSGELAAYLPYGLGMAVVTAAVMMIGTSLASQVAIMSSTQEPPTVLLAVIAAALASSLSAVERRVEIATILVAITVSALLAGIFFPGPGFLKNHLSCEDSAYLR